MVERGKGSPGSRSPDVRKRDYDAPIEELWDALTDPERISRWFLPVSGDYRVGGRYQLEHEVGARQARQEASGQAEAVAAQEPRPLTLGRKHQGPHPASVLGAQDDRPLAVQEVDAHALALRIPPRVPDLQRPPLGHDLVGAVHVQPGGVLDPVVGVDADGGASIVMARVAATSAASRRSSPGNRRVASSGVALQSRIRQRAKAW